MSDEKVRIAVKAVEEILQLKLNDHALYKTVFIHASYLNEHPDIATSNERLEFLGDAVVNLAVSEYYFRNTIDEEGKMHEKRKLFVAEKALADAARKLNLDNHLFLGRGEDNYGGRNKDKILADCFEALLGAIFLDVGYGKASQFAVKVLINE